MNKYGPTFKGLRFACLLVLASACSEAAVKDITVQKDAKIEEKKDPPTPNPSDSDLSNPLPEATQPVAVGGAFLYMKCAEETGPSKTQNEALVGCRLEDADGLRKAASTISSDYSYGWKSTESTNLQVAVKNLAGNTRYDTAFLFRSTADGSLENAMKSVQIVFFESASKVAAVKALPDILVQTSASQQQKGTFDFEAVRAELSAIVTSGEPTPPIP